MEVGRSRGNCAAGYATLNQPRKLGLRGFLDARTDSLDKHKLGEFHLGDEDSYHPDENDRFLIGIADCKPATDYLFTLK